MLHKLKVVLELTSGQLEVLKQIAAIKGDSLQTYIRDAVINELGGEVDLNFPHGDIRRVDNYLKLGYKPNWAGCLRNG